MAFRNFIYTEDDHDLAFLPKKPSPGFGTGSPCALVLQRLPVKRKLASGLSSSRVGRAKTSASKDDALILSISDTIKAVVDNVVNIRAREFLQVIEKMSGEADVIKARERSRKEECEELRVTCEADMAEFDQNLVVLALQEKISSLTADAEKAKLEASFRKEVKELKQDRRDVVSKVVPYGATELVATIKEPFDLSKAKGYHSSYKKEHTQAINDFATATFPWLDEFVVDAATPIEDLLSKKPLTLQKPAPSRTQIHVPSSQNVTPSSAPSSNPMSPPTDLVKPSTPLV
uniref:Uncharacterized protein n=1 Tax=Tanacetum cinerariifolium TaxID=118510 RepID=A0A6L2MLB3_TANCI|nr:hypothetical protein [Tanacetum cinerariifolium]